jgi:hypothetical protein
MSHLGWAVEFGGNTFLVGKAIEWCRKVLDQCRDAAAAGQVLSRSDVEAELKTVIRRAVANSAGEMYGGRYPLRNDVLTFGAQGIGVDDGASFMIEQSDLRWAGDVLATPQLETTPTAEALAELEKTPFNPAFLTFVDELELSVRSASCLHNDNIIYVGDLVQKTEAEMLRTPNFGRKPLNEIKEVLAHMGLHLGMEVPGWPPKNIEDLAKAYAARADA